MSPNGFIVRLRNEPATSDTVPWHSMAADDAEVAVMRGCLLNLAYGPRMEMPPGISATDVAGRFEELAYQLRY